MSKKFSAISLMLAFMMIFSACSSSGGSTDGEASPDQSTDNKEKVTLKIGLPGSYEVTSKEIIDGFITSHPHINVEIQEAPWGDFTSKIATQIAGNTMPDVWFQENATILSYGQRGVAEDLSSYIEADLKADEYIDGLFSAKTPDGKVWGVPHGINPIALAYNQDVFEKAGVAVPTDDWTYNDLIEASKALTVKEGDRMSQFGFIGSFSITNGWFPWIKQAGGSALDDTLTKSRFDDPKTATGLQQLYDGLDQGYFADIDFLKANGGELEVFASGKAAMYFLQYSLQVNMNESFADTNWDVVKIPKGVDGKRYVPMVANTWLVSSRAKQESKDAAWEFLKYYLSDEVQDMIVKTGSTLPVKKSALDQLKDSTTKPLNKAAFTDGIDEGGVTLDENATWSEWRILVQQVVNEIMVGNVSVEDGAKDIHTKVQEVLDSSK
ncbi:ABC transporter substrate-binding protein [Paenibacillus glucanolyticus]|uniref:ABC transporter substrate-binding protein n=1 Tax=Paenibacillus glucanolyticus TaxID=59843 RepID=UPI00128BAB7C|nr:sugar ABC transporter substrate-binding protein [Paenibacillus glucanolyticus]MPY15571.1 sugar ABC transporter substrate-binding protein [Paenibacillus glucanolyticus]